MEYKSTHLKESIEKVKPVIEEPSIEKYSGYGGEGISGYGGEGKSGYGGESESYPENDK